MWNIVCDTEIEHVKQYFKYILIYNIDVFNLFNKLRLILSITDQYKSRLN